MQKISFNNLVKNTADLVFLSIHYCTSHVVSFLEQEGLTFKLSDMRVILSITYLNTNL